MSRRCGRAIGRQPVQHRANLLCDRQIGLLAAPADIVLLARTAALQDQRPERPRMIIDIEPVAHVGAVAVDGQGLPLDGVEDQQRDQLLRELVGPVVVRAVGDQGRQAVGPVPGQAPGGPTRPSTPSRASLDRRRWSRVKKPCGAKRAVDLVGRDMKKAKARLLRLRQTRANSAAQLRADSGCRRCWSG